MNERVRYSYTYFLHPFKVSNRKKYLTSLFANKNISVKLFEKEKDLDIYSYFSSEAKLQFFESFQLKKEEQTKLINQKNIKNILKQKTVYLEYNNQQVLPAKMGTKDGIFFTIEKIEIICFSTGICFLTMKTQIENPQEFSQILDFNYKFREINLGKSQLKDYENITIQTNSFENAEQLIQLINSLTMQYEKEKEMYVYTYTCISSEDWRTKEDFKEIEEDYKKMINIKHSQDKEKILYGQSIYQTDYIHLDISKMCLGMVASSKDDFNYTKLPYYFERQYLYTFIIGLYYKEIIMEGQIEQKIMLTEDELGVKLLQAIEEQFNLTKKEKENKENIKLQLQKKNIKINKALLIIFGILFVFNLGTLWILLNILNR